MSSECDKCGDHAVECACEQDPLAKATQELICQKSEIIDLFCKTFLIAQGFKSEEQLRWLFENFVLEIKMMGASTGMHWQYQLVPKEKINEQ